MAEKHLFKKINILLQQQPGKGLQSAEQSESALFYVCVKLKVSV